MKKMLGRLKTILFLNFCLLVSYTGAQDDDFPHVSDSSYEVVAAPSEYIADSRQNYKIKLLMEALEITRPQFGDYNLSIQPGYLPNAVEIKLLTENGPLNVMFSATSIELENLTIPVRIPFRMGLLNYRLVVINKNALARFSQIKSVDDLKPFTVGLKSEWVLKDILQAHNFKLLEVETLDSLYKMLNEGRVDFLIRGVNEVFDELQQREGKIENVIVLPNIAIHLTSPLYAFVSKRNPDIANRLEIGFEMLIKSGDMQRLFLEQYNDVIQQAQLDSRRLLKISNPFLPPLTPLHRKELWYQLN